MLRLATAGLALWLAGCGPAPVAGAEGGPVAVEPAAVIEAEPFVSPLAPLDLTSPRATLAAVQGLGRELDDAYGAYRAAPSFALQGEIRQVLARAEAIFDLGAVPAAHRSEAGTASFGYLKDILMRMPPVDPGVLPDDAVTASVRLPGSEIELARRGRESRPDFVFSAETVARLPEFHARIIGLPILQPAPYDSWREEQVRFTGPFVPGGLVRAVPEPMQRRLLGTPAWKVVFSAVILVAAGLFAGRWAEFAAARAAAARPMPARCWRLTSPLVLAGLALAARGYLVGQVNLSGRFLEVVQVLTLGPAILGAAWATRAAIVIAGEHLGERWQPGGGRHDRHLVRLVAGVSGLVAAAVVVLWGANKLGAPLLGLAVGMGIGGLALALAAQSTIENLFAGASIFADRPFRVGDMILYAGGEGVVESIGPRSTRIRAPDGTQITVPNTDLARTQVTNKTCRDATLFRHVIALRQDTPGPQISDFCRRVMDLLETFPVDGLSEPPPRVRLAGLGEGAVRIEVQAELHAESEDEFYQLQEALLLGILGVIDARGLGLAYPTRTVLVGRDTVPPPAAGDDPA